MTLQGKLKYLYATTDARTGTGSKGQWTVQTLLFETTGQYPKKVVIDVWNEMLANFANAHSGSMWDISADPESREYNGKWYTNLRAWKITLVSSTATDQAPDSMPDASAVSASAPVSPTAEDDLPF